MSSAPAGQNAFGGWPGEVDSPPPGTTGTSTTTVGGDTGGPTTPAELSLPFWMDAPDVWDTVVIAGVPLPGMAKLTGAVRRKLDIQNAKGVNGATIADDGVDATMVDIELTLSTRQHWVSYQAIVGELDPNLGKQKLKAVDIANPVLALHAIRSIYVEEVSLPTMGSDPQTRVVRIKAVGWLPPPKPAPSKSKKPDEAAAAAAATKAMNAAQDFNNEIARIANQYPPGAERDAAAQQAAKNYSDTMVDDSPQQTAPAVQP